MTFALLKHELRLQLHETEGKRSTEYVSSYVNSVDVEEDWDRFWLRHEQEHQQGQETKKQGNGHKETKDVKMTQLADAFDRFVADTGSRVMLLLGDGGTGKSLALHELAQRQLEKLESVANAGGAPSTGPYCLSLCLSLCLFFLFCFSVSVVSS